VLAAAARVKAADVATPQSFGADPRRRTVIPMSPRPRAMQSAIEVVLLEPGLVASATVAP
jgi:hypothetical protein